MFCNLVSIYFDSPQLGIRKKANYKTSGYWSRDMLNFHILEKSLQIASPLHFVYDLSKKKFLMLYSTNWRNFVAWLPFLLEILINMWIAMVCFPRCDVIHFGINLIFLIKLFFYMTEQSRQKLNILGTERAFEVIRRQSCHHVETSQLIWWNKKTFFIIFKGV